MSKLWKCFLATGSVLELTRKLNSIEQDGYQIHSFAPQPLERNGYENIGWVIAAYKEK